MENEWKIETKKQKTPLLSEGYLLFQRRKRDSNPRRCDPQQFSRLPHSTTLPFLLCECKYTFLFDIRKYLLHTLLGGDPSLYVSLFFVTMEELFPIILLVVVGFLAGVINTLAGGGSLLTLPVLIFLGLPPHIANGTNRIAIVVQSLSGAVGYRSKGMHTYPFNMYLGISASVGAVIGAQLAVEIDGALFNKMLAVIMIVVGILVLVKSKPMDIQMPGRLTGKYLWMGIIGFFIIGIYGGFINAGVGFVIMIFLNRVNQMSLLNTNVTKVTVVTIYSLVALVMFAYNDAIDWKIGFWMALGTSAGAWITSRWSVKKGDRVIRIAMLVMMAVMAVKLWFFQ